MIYLIVRVFSNFPQLFHIFLQQNVTVLKKKKKLELACREFQVKPSQSEMQLRRRHGPVNEACFGTTQTDNVNHYDTNRHVIIIPF